MTTKNPANDELVRTQVRIGGLKFEAFHTPDVDPTDYSITGENGDLIPVERNGEKPPQSPHNDRNPTEK